MRHVIPLEDAHIIGTRQLMCFASCCFMFGIVAGSMVTTVLMLAAAAAR